VEQYQLMIRHSFIFLERIGSRKERQLWSQGIQSWQDFLKAQTIKGIPAIKKQYYDRKLRESQQALAEDNSSFFIGKLKPKEMWRLYHYFKEECCFLDGEIDSSGRVILVGLSSEQQTKHFVCGANLEQLLLQKELEKYKLLITFNGSSFDLPKLKKQYGITIGIPHIDLKPLCINLGLKGGLKEVEKGLHLQRPTHLYGNPVQLWKAFHASGDKEYLELLIEYNREDTENLKWIMDHIYKRMCTERTSTEIPKNEKNHPIYRQ